MPVICRSAKKKTRLPSDVLNEPEKWGGILDEFPARLKKMRERQRKSRRVLSELCGLPPDAVRRYERGEAKPSMDALIKLADYFEVSIDYLIGRSDYKL